MQHKEIGCILHSKAIADGIQKEMKEKYDKASVLRMAFVAYRDYMDSNRFDVIDFHQTPNLASVEARLQVNGPVVVSTKH